MKTFQKIALVSAIAAAPFAAQADLTPMDDALMGDTTGQAGVTIEISVGSAGITVGEIEYTDTAGTLADGVTPDGDGGSVLMQDLSIKNITKLTQTIDVDEGGHLKLGITGGDALVNKQLAADGTLETAVGTNAGSAGNGVAGIEIALGATDGSSSAVLLQGTNGNQAELVNNLYVNMDLGDSTTTIYNMSNKGNLGTVDVVGDYATATSSLAIGMKAAFRINDLDVGMFGYTQGQADAKYDTTAAKAALGGAAGTVSYNATTGQASSDNPADDTLVDNYNAVQGANRAVATGSAVQIENLSFMGSDGGMVEVDQVIWADSSAVYMQIGEIKGDLNIHAIKIGGSSIGSVAVRDINLAGMTQKIYGH